MASGKRKKRGGKKKQNLSPGARPAVPSGQWPGGQPPRHQSLTSKGRAGSRTNQPVVSGQRPVTSGKASHPQWSVARWPATEPGPQCQMAKCTVASGKRKKNEKNKTVKQKKKTVTRCQASRPQWPVARWPATEPPIVNKQRPSWIPI